MVFLQSKHPLPEPGTPGIINQSAGHHGVGLQASNEANVIRQACLKGVEKFGDARGMIPLHLMDPIEIDQITAIGRRYVLRRISRRLL